MKDHVPLLQLECYYYLLPYIWNMFEHTSEGGKKVSLCQLLR